MRWEPQDISSILALIYDLDYVGGARYLRARRGLGEMFKSVFVAHQEMLRERYVSERDSVHTGAVQVRRIEHADVQSFSSTAIEPRQQGQSNHETAEVKAEAGAAGWVGEEGSTGDQIALRPMDAGERRRLLIMLGVTA